MNSPAGPSRSLADKLVHRFRNQISVAAHAVIFMSAFFVASGMLDNFWRLDQWFYPVFLKWVWAPVGIKLLVFGAMGLYQGFWRYVGIRDAVQAAKATTWSSALFIAFFYVMKLSLYFLGEHTPFANFAESIFVLDWMATIVLVIGSRAAVRLYLEERRLESRPDAVKCLILGAGNTGEMLLRELLRMPNEKRRVVGFLDDDPVKQSARIHDVPVLGRIEEVRAVAQEQGVTELLIAMPNASKKRLRHVVEMCQGANLRFRMMPGVADLIDGRVKVSQMRDVEIKDLLGREQVHLDEAAIGAYLQDKRIVVTGAGGSIGSEICRQIMRFRPARLIMIEQAENNLFMIDRELAKLAPDVPRVTYIADICDAARVDAVMTHETPHAVFHAAAHKHVPMMECNVGEAIKNNVQGTLTVARAAQRVAVGRFVMISTDKAVNPTSVMGCTKRVAELGLQHLARQSRTQFITVRFGNVLGSSGSVVPIFREQIARGGPIEVTHPDMTRYFMTIPEATQLVLQAGAMGAGGEIFVLDMGEPVKIVDLAREMITLSGFRPHEDIEIVYTGVRPGEKLYEELSVSGENMSPTRHEKIYVWRQRSEDWDRIAAETTALVAAADQESPDELRRRLKRIVAEYQCNGGNSAC